jgi:hypothetical protein
MGSSEKVFGIPIWAASLLVVALFGYWLLRSVKSGTSLSLGLMPQFDRSTQPLGYWLAVSLAAIFFAVALLTLISPSWIAHLPGQPAR